MTHKIARKAKQTIPQLNQTKALGIVPQINLQSLSTFKDTSMPFQPNTPQAC